MRKFWDEKYSEDAYVYGNEPNTYFKHVIEKLEPGKALLPAEGEGRNAVFAAKLGWYVDAFDWSTQAKQKALNLASDQNVAIHYTLTDLNSYDFPPCEYDLVALIYIHVSEEERANFFKNVIQTLKPGGTIIFEGFATEQIAFNSGGPKDESLLYSLETIINHFIDFNFVNLAKERIVLSEGTGHDGPGVAIRFTGAKPHNS